MLQVGVGNYLLQLSGTLDTCWTDR